MIKRKLSDKKGFTLAEVLICVAILAIFATIAMVGTTALFGTSEKMMAVSKAAVLGSDVMKIITNEMRFGESFVAAADGKLSSYNSTSYGDNCSISVATGEHAGQLVITQTPNGGGADAAKIFYPLSTAAYDEVRVLSIDLTVTTESGRTLITCTVSITDDGTRTAWSNSTTVVPLYQKKAA